MMRSLLPLWILGLCVGACRDTAARDETDVQTDDITAPDPTGPTGDTAAGDCGNDMLDPYEECDDDLSTAATCADVPGYVDGTDLGCLADCRFDTTGCVSASEWIAAVRAASDGDVSLSVAKAHVTALRPLAGSDQPGFFVQAEAAGPALFVEIDPDDLAPNPRVGDLVRFTVTEVDRTGDALSVTEIEDFAVDGNVGNVSFLLQNLTPSNSVVTDVDDLESELIAMEATLLSSFQFAGAGNVKAEIATSGYPTGDPNLAFRLSTSLVDELDIATGCEFSFEGVVWRFNDEVQPSVFDADSVVFESCPAPTVESAVASASDTVVITFDRFVRESSVAAEDFVFDNGLTAIAVASVAERTVTVTTSTQGSGTPYTVTVTGVTDTLGEDVDPTANTATFDGFEVFQPQLYISEVDADTVGDDTLEFIEVWNNTGAPVDLATDGYYLLLLNGGDAVGVIDGTYDAIALTGTVADGDVIVVGSSGVANVDLVQANDFIQNGPDGILLVQCASCTDTATDFPNDSDVGTKTTFMSGGGAVATKVDAIAHDTNDADDTALWDKLGVSAQWNEAGSGNSAGDSLTRTTVAEFSAVAPTPGTP